MLLGGPAAAGKRQVGSFTLEAAGGRPFSSDDVRGKVWVAYTFFSSCATTCPLTTLQAGRLARDFAASPDFLVVGLTTDPEHDTPARLAEVAKAAHADPARWVLATGQPGQLRELTEKDFRIGFDPPQTGGAHGGHAGLFVLVGRDGVIHGYYRTGDRAAYARLRDDARALLQTR